MHNSLWIGVQKVTIPLGNLDDTHPIGYTVDHCACMHCPFLVDIHWAFSGMTKAASCQKFLKSYLVTINDKPVFSLTDVSQKVALLQNYNKSLFTLALSLAPEC